MTIKMHNVFCLCFLHNSKKLGLGAPISKFSAFYQYRGLISSLCMSCILQLAMGMGPPILKWIFLLLLFLENYGFPKIHWNIAHSQKK